MLSSMAAQSHTAFRAEAAAAAGYLSKHLLSTQVRISAAAAAAAERESESKKKSAAAAVDCCLPTHL